jgi:protein ImuA
MRIATPHVQALHDRIGQMSSARPRWPSGVASLDTALSGGFAYGHVHEFYAAEAEDMPATAGFALALTNGMARTDKGILWLRSARAATRQGVLQANGWAEFGAEPGDFIFGVIADVKGLLKATVDALRSNALGAVVVETCGRFSELDMIASRRLVLAAEKAETPLFMLRADAEPTSSAAETRWQISSSPSRAFPANAPGTPVFDIKLLRQRSGPSGLSWQLEWDRDRRIFIEATASGALVSAPLRRPRGQRGNPARSLTLRWYLSPSRKMRCGLRQWMRLA